MIQTAESHYRTHGYANEQQNAAGHISDMQTERTEPFKHQTERKIEYETKTTEKDMEVGGGSIRENDSHVNPQQYEFSTEIRSGMQQMDSPRLRVPLKQQTGKHVVSDKARKDSGNDSPHEASGSQFEGNSSQEIVNPMGALDTSLPQIELIDANAIQYEHIKIQRRSLNDMPNFDVPMLAQF